MIKKCASLTADDNERLAGVNGSEGAVMDGLDKAGTRKQHQSIGGFRARVIT